jgi:hypothetical protein
VKHDDHDFARGACRNSGDDRDSSAKIEFGSKESNTRSPLMFSGSSNRVDGTAKAAIADATELEPRLCIIVPWMRRIVQPTSVALQDSNKDERPDGAWAGTNVKTMQSYFSPTASKRATLPPPDSNVSTFIIGIGTPFRMNVREM